MAKYCFIIPRTPQQYNNALRSALWEICKRSLINQRETSWVAYVIGNKDEGDERFIFLEYDVLPKQQKIKLALDRLRDTQDPPEYVIRLDDDDIMSEVALSANYNAGFDCLYDKRHTFYEICTGKISQQKRTWYANTIVHKFEHATRLVPWKEKEEYLLCTDHSQVWHTYYGGKKCISTEGSLPLYMRILSPFSITSRTAISEKELVKSYIDYLLRFGSWSANAKDVKGFEDSLNALQNIHRGRSEYGLPVLHWPSWKLLLNRIRGYKAGW